MMSAHVIDRESQQALLVGGRLFGLIIAAVVLVQFAFDPVRATFLGLLSAGLAVGLHDVLLATGGRRGI